MLKILHIADAHLDSRFSGLSQDESVKKRKALRGVFRTALEFAEEKGCQAVLISGDLFDGEYYTSDTLSFLSDCFRSYPDRIFVISPGNHDPYNRTSPYKVFDFPENVYIFREENLSSFRFDRLNLTVYGYAFTSEKHMKNPLDGFSANGSGFSLLCAHTELDNPISSYAPIQSKYLGMCGLDYAALGHIHTVSPEIRTSGNTLYAYSGCLAGRDFSEYGIKGGIFITLDEINGEKTIKAERVKFCGWSYDTVDIDLSGTVSEGDALELIRNRLRRYTSNSGCEYILRLRLTGNVSYEPDPENIRHRLEKDGVREVKNEAVSSYSFLELNTDFTLKGEFYKALRPYLESENAEQRLIASRALKYGLAALSGNDLEI